MTHRPAPRLAAPVLRRLREVLASARFTTQGVVDLLGAVAFSALERDETAAARRATRGGSARETLVRLWLLGDAVPEGVASRALPGLLEPLLEAGMVTRRGGSVAAEVDLRPVAVGDREWWVVADRRRSLDGLLVPPVADQVLGSSPAATSLAQLTVRRPVRRALDLGTGCGIQALQLGEHSAEVVATDVNPRALGFAELNAELNGVELDLRRGDLYDPVAGEEFDLVVSNPPFVLAPPTGHTLVYRDSRLPGDELVRRVLVGAAEHLAVGGVAHVLGNWAHHAHRSWEQRLADWLGGPSAGGGLDVWVVQREVLDPARYAELWLRDAGLRGGPDYLRRYDAWLEWFEEQGVTGVGMGWVVLRRTGRAEVEVSMEHWPYDVEQPLGEEIGRWAARCDRLSGATDAALLATAWRRPDGLRQETVGDPGAPDPRAIVLRQEYGMRRARQVDTVTAALVGASDGDLTAQQLLGAVGELLGEPVDAARTAATVRELVRDGYLI